MEGLQDIAKFAGTDAGIRVADAWDESADMRRVMNLKLTASNGLDQDLARTGNFDINILQDKLGTSLFKDLGFASLWKVGRHIVLQGRG